MPVYSKDCIDHAAGFDIIDILTGVIYSDIEAYIQPHDIKSRLVHRPRKLGAMVMTIEECDECLRQRRINTNNEEANQ